MLCARNHREDIFRHRLNRCTDTSILQPFAMDGYLRSGLPVGSLHASINNQPTPDEQKLGEAGREFLAAKLTNGFDR